MAAKPLIMIPMTTPDPEHLFIDRVLATVARYGLLPLGRRRPAAEREPVVVGVSGGPDSVALVHVLARLAEEDRLAIAPVLAHLHHGLRGAAADRDARLVADLAERLGLPYVLERADIRAEAEARGVGVEEAGRAARRRFFIETARARGARKVALGHHGGDRVETVLFNILRGTGIDGLAALGPRAPLPSPSMGEGGRGERPGEGEPFIAPSPYPLPPGERDLGIEIVRPMVHPSIDRDLVLAYLERTGLPWRTDETNADTAYTRNRLRHEVLPMLGRTVNPAVGDALFRLADQAEAARQVLDEALARAWRRIVREAPGSKGARPPQAKRDVTLSGAKGLAVGEPQEERPRRDASPRPAGAQNDSAEGGRPRALLIDADDFAALAPWLQGAMVRRAVQRLGGGLKHLSAARTEEVVAALLSKPVAGPVDLPGGLAAERRRRAIRIGPKT